MRLVSLVRQRPDLTLAPPASLKLDMAGGEGGGEQARAQALSPQPSALRRAQGK